MLYFNLDTYDISVADNELKHNIFIGVNRMFMEICNNGSIENKTFFLHIVFLSIYANPHSQEWKGSRSERQVFFAWRNFISSNNLTS